jgi:hypothetical protein
MLGALGMPWHMVVRVDFPALGNHFALHSS